MEDAETFGFWTLKPFISQEKNLWSRYPSNSLAHNIRWQENKIYMFQEVASDFTELGQTILCQDGLWGRQLEGRGLSAYSSEWFCLALPCYTCQEGPDTRAACVQVAGVKC